MGALGRYRRQIAKNTGKLRKPPRKMRETVKAWLCKLRRDQRAKEQTQKAAA